MLVKTGVAENYQIGLSEFSCLIRETERLYNHRNNSYHNFKHGITVMNYCYRFFKTGNIQDYFMKTGTAALMFGSMMHDIDHTSRNNMFEMNTYSKLAIRYNDNSVLENHHAATAFELLSKRECNIFVHMNIDEYPLFRKFVIAGILATDIKKHFVDVKEFQERLNEGDFEPYENGEHLEDFLLLIGTLVHSADLYVPTFPVEISKELSELVNQEFITQSKQEIEENLPITPFYKGLEDMETMAKSEKFFIAGIVKPLWQELNRFCQGGLHEAMSNIELNLQNWEAVLKAEQEKKSILAK